MKKLVLVLITLMLVLTGCSNGESTGSGDYKVGTGSITAVTGSEATAEEAGSVQFYTTIATILLDGEEIVDVKFDVAQNSVTFDDAGVVTTPAETPSKLEKGDAYGMKETSANIGNIEGGAEWYEQAASLEEWMVGQTVEEVLAMDLADNVPTHEDLLTSVTITVDAFLAAIEQAAELAVEVEGTPAKIGSANTTAISGGDNGKPQANTEIAHVVLDADGNVLNAFIDVAQNSFTVTEEGKIDGELVGIDSKYVRKEDYNMKETSANIGNIEGGGEWYEQADFYTDYLVGKSKADIDGFEIAEDVFTEEDLFAGVTMNVGSFHTNLIKAIDQAEDIE